MARQAIGGRDNVDASCLDLKTSAEGNMRIALTMFVMALLSGCQSLPAPDTAKAQVAATTREWIAAMSSHDAKRVVALYDPDAVLWGTRSPKLRDTPAAVGDYFNILHSVPPSYKAVLGEQRIRVYGDVAINTGTYTFSEVHDGKEVVRPARFSFVFRYHDGRWLIVDHHSSAVPSAPSS